MATDREIAFPIDDFMGVDRLVSREDSEQANFYAAQNLWEKQIGILETRGHSVNTVTSWPSTVASLGNTFRVYDKFLDHRRLVTVHTDQDISYENGLPANVSLAFVSDTEGRWLYSVDSARETRPSKVILRLVGYGVDKSYVVTTSDIPGYSATNGTYRLDVTVSSVFDSKITGMEIICGFALSNSGSPEPEDGNYILHAGYIDLQEDPTGTTSFYGCPCTRKSGAANNLESGEVARDFTVADPASAVITGTLTPGKTYYILVAAQHLEYGADKHLSWRAYDINSSTGVVAHKVGDGKSAIRVYDINVASVNNTTYPIMVFIGEHPQLLRPYKIVHGSECYITDFPKGSPCVADIEHISATEMTVRFKGADFSPYDTFARVDDDGTFRQVFLTRESSFNADDVPMQYFPVDIGDGEPLGIWFRGYHVNRSQGNIFDMEQFGTVGFMVNGDSPTGDQTGGYFVTDGTVVARAVLDYAAAYELPNAKHITKYQNSIVIAGGTKSDARGRFFYSNPNNPFDFASSVDGVPNYVAVDADAEGISGIGIFTNSTAQAGTESRLVLTKKNSLWLFRDLPTSGSSASPAQNLSGKAGSVGGFTIVNTPIGTIVAAVDNVYLLRESGEPIPVGDPISYILKGGDLTRAVAEYHDEQYKLSFYHPDYPGTSGYNNVEFWLDIKKMKQMQGRPDWKGPMVGRSVDYSMVEDLDADGLSYNTASSRFCVDRENIRLFRADVAPEDSDTQILDFATPVTSLFETKDFQISDEDKNWNKLHTRTYWKVKTNKLSADPLEATEVTWMDGIQVESKSIEMYASAAGGFDSQPQKVFSFFPVGRPRGRTLRKRISTTDRIGIGGFSVFYRIERRRI